MNHRTNRRRIGAVTVVLSSLFAASGIAAASPAEELEHVSRLFAEAQPGSPAQFRLFEERDRLRSIVAVSAELDAAEAAAAGSEPGSPASFRAVETAAALHAELEALRH